MTEKEMLQRMLMDMSLLKKLITNHIKNEQRPDTTKEILTVEECAELTGLKKSTLYRLTHERKSHFSNLMAIGCSSGEQISWLGCRVIVWRLLMRLIKPLLII